MRPQDALVQGWSNRGPETGLFRAPAGFGWVAQTRETGKQSEAGHPLRGIPGNAFDVQPADRTRPYPGSTSVLPPFYVRSTSVLRPQTLRR